MDQEQDRVMQTHNGEKTASGDYRRAGRGWRAGAEEVLVEGQEVWDEWTGQSVEDTDWRKGAKDQWEAMEKAVLRRKRLRSTKECGKRQGLRQGAMSISLWLMSQTVGID